jgi:hypothetical protein
MKLKIQLVIFIFSFICISSCSSTEIIKNEGNYTEKVSAGKTYKKRDVKDKKDMEKKGKIEVSNNSVYFVIKWTSRSRITFKVTGQLKDEIKKLKDRIIEAKGNIEYKNKWSGTIEITSYKIIE